MKGFRKGFSPKHRIYQLYNSIRNHPKTVFKNIYHLFDSWIYSLDRAQQRDLSPLHIVSTGVIQLGAVGSTSKMAHSHGGQCVCCLSAAGSRRALVPLRMGLFMKASPQAAWASSYCGDWVQKVARSLSFGPRNWHIASTIIYYSSSHTPDSREG